MEQWRLIPGTYGFYEASSLGRIRRVGRNPKTLQPTADGYLAVELRRADGSRWVTSVNYAVALAFHGPPPSPTHQAAHKNNDRADNRPENIMWATPMENTGHKFIHGTNLKHHRPFREVDGEKHYRCPTCPEAEQWKPKDAFHPSRNPELACGITTNCRACANRARSDRRRAKRLQATA